MTTLFNKYLDAVTDTEPIKLLGRVTRVQGLLIVSKGPSARVGELCRIILPHTRSSIIAEVIALNGPTVQLMTYSSLQGIEIGCQVIASGSVLSVPVGDMLLGTEPNATGLAADGLPDPN